MKYLVPILTYLLLLSCSDEATYTESNLLAPLTVQVNNNAIVKTQIEGVYMPDQAEIGLFLKDAGGITYETKTYDNIKYTANGTGVTQTWEMDPTVPVALTRTQGQAYAYYPRQDEVTDFRAIPITNDGTDWMYNEQPATGLSNLHNNASFTMSHALAIVRCKIVRGNYEGTGEIHTISVQSNALATDATLDLETPAVYGHTGVGAALSTTTLGTLSSTELAHDFWAIPVGTTETLQFSIQIDGTAFEYTLPHFEPQAGAVYQYTFSVDMERIQLTSVRICAWSETVVNPIDSAIDRSDYAVEWSEAVKEDGVYAITPEGKALAYEFVKNNDDYVGIAFTLFGKAYQVAKYNALTSEGKVAGPWWKEDAKDIPTMTNFLSIDQYNYWGQLPLLNGYYYFEDKQIDGDWQKWPTYDNTRVALTDFDGKRNTEQILAYQVVDEVPLANTIGETLLLFRSNDTYNEGHDDWFIPSCGQLAFMYLFREQLNDLFSRLGVNYMNAWHYTSTEFRYGTNVCAIAFGDGSISYAPKASERRARFIREIY